MTHEKNMRQHASGQRPPTSRRPASCRRRKPKLFRIPSRNTSLPTTNEPRHENPPGGTIDSDNHTIICGKRRLSLEWVAVMASQAIRFEATPLPGGGHRLTVEEQRFAEALEHIRDYESERGFFARWRRRMTVPPSNAPGQTGYGGVLLAVAAMIFFFFLITGEWNSESAWFRTGAMNAGKMASGDWWRPITALTLHSSPSHVLGNAFFMFVLVAALGGRYGQAAACFLALTAGTLGNAAAAATSGFRGGEAVGASTAVFAVVGLLGAIRLIDYWRHPESRGGGWLPVLAAVALLALNGAGPGSDLLGHLFGFIAGAALGLPAAVFRFERISSKPATIFICWNLFVFTIAAAWLTATRHAVN